MKIVCPRCGREVTASQVNMATDLAYCEACSEGFKISEQFEQAQVNADIVLNPSKGTWFKEGIDRFVVGASTRHPSAFFLVPFMCVWSGFSLGGIYGSQIVKGDFDLMMSLFGIPFVLGSILFWAMALMTICGKVEVTVGQVSSVFTGIGRIGWTRRFDWPAVRTIQEVRLHFNEDNTWTTAIVMEGDKRIKFGTALREERRYFVLNALRFLKAQSR